MKGSVFEELERLVLDIFLGSTFRNSWFIVALAIGTILVFYLTNYIGNRGTFAVGVLLYTLCCFASDYGNTGLLKNVIVLYPRTIYQSVPISIIWITCGKIIAEHEKTISDISIKTKITITAISLLGMYAEFIVLDKTCGIATEAYSFFMIPFCFVFFCLIYNLEISIKKAAFWRHWSTVTYCFHTSFAWAVCKVMDKMELSYLLPVSIIIYGFIIIICVGVTVILIRLSKQDLFKWLKYSI